MVTEWRRERGDAGGACNEWLCCYRYLLVAAVYYCMWLSGGLVQQLCRQPGQYTALLSAAEEERWRCNYMKLNIDIL